MPEQLIVNPFAFLYLPAEPGADMFVTAPVPGRGLTSLKVSPSDDPSLYSVLSDIAPLGLQSMDIGSDLTDAERVLLKEHGILTDPANVPEQKLFSCPLDSVNAAGTVAVHALSVNPTLKFEPFNLLNFRTWIPERHMSPHSPTAWVTDPETAVTLGYWLTPEQAEIVSALRPGETIDPGGAGELTPKLLAAGILTGDERDEAKTSVAAAYYAKKKYAVIRRLIPDAQVRAMQAFYREYTRQGFMQFGDGQVPRRYIAHNEPLARYFHQQLTATVARVVGRPVKPSYCYSAAYVEGADLKPHTDREQCEYSISLQIDYTPDLDGAPSPWALSVEPLSSDAELIYNGVDAGWDSVYARDPAVRTDIHLANGDGLFYAGRELVHYRTALPDGHRSTSLFFHYVDADYTGRLT